MTQTHDMGKYVPMNAGQLKQLIKNVDDEKPIRVWVECKNKDGVTYLEGRKLAGVLDEEDRLCLCALHYNEGEL